MRFPATNVLALVCLVAVTAFRAEAAVYDVASRGASREGTVLVTTIVQRAIDDCHAAGGGRVFFPPGTYLTGTLELKDNVYLELSAGAVLLGSPRMEDYRPPYLIHAAGAANFGILGQGTIDGNGATFWKDKPQPLIRPERLILFENCRHIRIDGIKLLNSPNWNLELLYCSFVWINGVSIISPSEAPNTDGIDPTSSSNIFISNCYIDTGDDAICPKSRGTTPTENVVVENCILRSDDTAIKLGTRSEAPIRNLLFNNIIIRDTQYGIGFYAKDGGVFENIRFSNITIETATDEVARDDRPSGNYAIFVDIERRDARSPLSAIRDVYLSNISIKSIDARCLFLGQPDQRIENLQLSNIDYTQHRHRTFAGSKKPRGVKSLTDRAANDYSHIPANFTFVHVSDLQIDRLTIRDLDRSGRHERHMLWGKDVKGATITGLRTTLASPNTTLSQISLEDSSDIRINGAKPAIAPVPFLSLAGRETADVALLFNDFKGTERIVVFDETVGRDRVVIEPMSSR